MALFPRKVTLRQDGLYLDDQKITGCVGAEIKNINPDPDGLMEVALLFRVPEVDIQYCQASLLRKEFGDD